MINTSACINATFKSKSGKIIIKNNSIKSKQNNIYFF